MSLLKGAFRCVQAPGVRSQKAGAESYRNGAHELELL